MESTESKEITKFKIAMAGWMYDLSMCFSRDASPLKADNIASMVNLITRIIVANKMTFELEPYIRSINQIASGKSEIYQFNVVNLMKVFNIECERFEESKKPLRPEKW